MRSWRTTTLGVLGALAILIGQVQALLDDDPSTTVEFEAVLAALGVLGLGVAARDNGVSSQDVGIRK